MTRFVENKCPRCGEIFGLSEATEQTLRRSTATFHCPFGHPLHFPLGPSEEDKLRQERDRLKQKVAEKEDEARIAWATATQQRERREMAEHRARAFKGQVTKLKTRAAAGVCPCCSRSFQNLRRHMATKHAGFLADEAQAAERATLQ